MVCRELRMLRVQQGKACLLRQVRIVVSSYATTFLHSTCLVNTWFGFLCALEFIQTLRDLTDSAKVTTVVPIYQAGEQLFNLFDKVCTIYDRKMAYSGPVKEAERCFVNMRYESQSRRTGKQPQTFWLQVRTEEHLHRVPCINSRRAVTDPKARVIRPGLQGVVPRTAEEMVS